MLIMQEILRYFLLGIRGLIFLSVCYVPVYFILRKRIPFMRQIPYFLLGVCVLVICTATFLQSVVFLLLDGESIFVTHHMLNLIPFKFIVGTWEMGAQGQITQSIANILMFMPLGFILPIAVQKARTWRKVLVCVMGFSFFIEFVQFFIGRSADIDDLMLNTLGGMLGYFIFTFLSKLFKDKRLWKILNGNV